jgi:hypothetical protein
MLKERTSMAPRLLCRVLFRPAALVLAAGMLPVLAAGTATGAVAAGGVAPGLPVAGAPAGTPATAPPGWRLFHTIAISGRQPSLDAVSATNAGHAWAVGATGLTDDGPLVERWSDGTWHTASLPKTALTALSGLRAVGGGATNMWAFDSQARWLHWNGQHWSVGTLPKAVDAGAPDTIRSVTVFSHTDAWAFGADDEFSPYAAHFNGSAWKVVSVPSAGLMSASAVSSTDIWGLVNDREDLSGAPFQIVRWNGKSWRDAPGPDQSLGTFSSIYAHNNHDVWLGGVAPDGAGLAAHWTGTSWHVAKLPPVATFGTDDLSILTPDGGGGLWALASCDCGPAWRLWHETGGKWSGPILPRISGDITALGGIAWVPQTASVWGVGLRVLGSSRQGMILLDGKVP